MAKYVRFKHQDHSSYHIDDQLDDSSQRFVQQSQSSQLVVQRLYRLIKGILSKNANLTCFKRGNQFIIRPLNNKFTYRISYAEFVHFKSLIASLHKLNCHNGESRELTEQYHYASDQLLGVANDKQNYLFNQLTFDATLSFVQVNFVKSITQTQTQNILRLHRIIQPVTLKRLSCKQQPINSGISIANASVSAKNDDGGGDDDDDSVLCMTKNATSTNNTNNSDNNVQFSVNCSVTPLDDNNTFDVIDIEHDRSLSNSIQEQSKCSSKANHIPVSCNSSSSSSSNQCYGRRPVSVKRLLCKSENVTEYTQEYHIHDELNNNIDIDFNRFVQLRQHYKKFKKFDKKFVLNKCGYDLHHFQAVCSHSTTPFYREYFQANDPDAKDLQSLFLTSDGKRMFPIDEHLIASKLKSLNLEPLVTTILDEKDDSDLFSSQTETTTDQCLIGEQVLDNDDNLEYETIIYDNISDYDSPLVSDQRVEKMMAGQVDHRSGAAMDNATNGNNGIERPFLMSPYMPLFPHTAPPLDFQAHQMRYTANQMAADEMALNPSSVGASPSLGAFSPMLPPHLAPSASMLALNNPANPIVQEYLSQILQSELRNRLIGHLPPEYLNPLYAHRLINPNSTPVQPPPPPPPSSFFVDHLNSFGEPATPSPSMSPSMLPSHMTTMSTMPSPQVHIDSSSSTHHYDNSTSPYSRASPLDVYSPSTFSPSSSTHSPSPSHSVPPKAHTLWNPARQLSSPSNLPAKPSTPLPAHQQTPSPRASKDETESAISLVKHHRIDEKAVVVENAICPCSKLKKLVNTKFHCDKCKPAPLSVAPSSTPPLTAPKLAPKKVASSSKSKKAQPKILPITPTARRATEIIIPKAASQSPQPLNASAGDDTWPTPSPVASANSNASNSNDHHSELDCHNSQSNENKSNLPEKTLKRPCNEVDLSNNESDENLIADYNSVRANKRQKTISSQDKENGDPHCIEQLLTLDVNNQIKTGKKHSHGNNDACRLATSEQNSSLISEEKISQIQLSSKPISNAVTATITKSSNTNRLIDDDDFLSDSDDDFAESRKVIFDQFKLPISPLREESTAISDADLNENPFKFTEKIKDGLNDENNKSTNQCLSLEKKKWIMMVKEESMREQESEIGGDKSEIVSVRKEETNSNEQSAPKKLATKRKRRSNLSSNEEDEILARTLQHLEYQKKRPARRAKAAIATNLMHQFLKGKKIKKEEESDEDNSILDPSCQDLDLDLFPMGFRIRRFGGNKKSGAARDVGGGADGDDDGDGDADDGAHGGADDDGDGDGDGDDGAQSGSEWSEQSGTEQSAQPKLLPSLEKSDDKKKVAIKKESEESLVDGFPIKPSVMYADSDDSTDDQTNSDRQTLNNKRKVAKANIRQLCERYGSLTVPVKVSAQLKEFINADTISVDHLSVSLYSYIRRSNLLWVDKKTGKEFVEVDATLSGLLNGVSINKACRLAHLGRLIIARHLYDRSGYLNAEQAQANICKSSNIWLTAKAKASLVRHRPDADSEDSEESFW